MAVRERTRRAGTAAVMAGAIGGAPGPQVLTVPVTLGEV
jgi:hypothetical protein